MPKQYLNLSYKLKICIKLENFTASDKLGSPGSYQDCGKGDLAKGADWQRVQN